MEVGVVEVMEEEIEAVEVGAMEAGVVGEIEAASVEIEEEVEEEAVEVVPLKTSVSLSKFSSNPSSISLLLAVQISYL